MRDNAHMCYVRVRRPDGESRVLVVFPGEIWGEVVASEPFTDFWGENPLPDCPPDEEWTAGKGHPRLYQAMLGVELAMHNQDLRVVAMIRNGLAELIERFVSDSSFRQQAFFNPGFAAVQQSATTGERPLGRASLSGPQ